MRGTHKLERPGRESSQDTETIQASKWHSPAGEPRQRDKLGHGKKASQKEALTPWKAQMERQVRTQKKSKPARGTHILESSDRVTIQDMGTMQDSKSTHILGSSGREPSQDTETMQPSNGHSRTGESRWREVSQDTETMQASKGHSHPG